MERAGYKNPTDRQAAIYGVVGKKNYYKIREASFNVAYAERILGVEPQHGSYKRDMLYNQNLIENLLYQRMVVEGYDEHLLKGFLAEFTEEACIEGFRSAMENKRLNKLIDGDQ